MNVFHPQTVGLFRMESKMDPQRIMRGMSMGIKGLQYKTENRKCQNGPIITVKCYYGLDLCDILVELTLYIRCIADENAT